MGVGSVWLGTYPQMERVNRQRELFGLPETVIPHSIIAFGYPDAEGENSPRSMPQGMERPEGAAPNMPPPPREPMKKGEYEESRIHLDRW